MTPRHAFVDDTPTRTCVLPHHRDPDRPRAATDGLLCAGHRAGLERHVAELPGLHTALLRVLATTGRGGEHVTGTPACGLTLNPAAVRARDLIWRDLRNWSRLIHNDRHLTSELRDDVTWRARFVDHHLAWVIEQPWVDEMARDFADTHATAWAAAYPARARRFDIVLPDGTPAGCTEPAHGPRLEHGPPPCCPGHLTAWVRDDDALLPSELTCSADPRHRWSAAHWMTLGRKLRIRPPIHADNIVMLAKRVLT